MKNVIKKLIFSLALISLIILPGLALAQANNTATPPGKNAPTKEITNRLKTVGNESGYNLNMTPQKVIGFIIGAFIDFLGIIFIILIIISGYTWMTAEGNEEKIEKASSTIKEAIIGLVLTLSAWTLWTFVLENLILKK